MVGDDHHDADEQPGEATDRTRRNLLKLTGAGAGVAALGGLSVSAFGQQDGETPTPDGNESTTDGTGEDQFLADLVDPVFGYPLAEGETEEVDVGHVVEAAVEEGSGAHEGFPLDTESEDQAEIPAEFFFDPVGLHVEPGDLVHFDVLAGLHTVTAFHDKFEEPDFDIPTRVPDGVPGFTSPPLMPGESWVYQFTEKGVYDYLCLPHLSLGMVARLVVLDPEEDDVTSDTFDEPASGELPPNVGRVLTADELDPANVVEQGSVAWADLSLATQGTPTETETETETGT